MNRAHICSVVLSFLGSVAVLLAGIGASGCAGIHDGGVCMVAHPSSGSSSSSSRSSELPGGAGDSELWRKGISAFERGDYHDAETAFQCIVKSAGDEDLRLDALYALACTRLILARNAEEYSAAMNLLDLWSHLPPSSPSVGDPRITASFLKRILEPPTRGQGAGLRACRTGRSEGSPSSSEAIPPDRQKNKQKEIIKVVKEKNQECEGLLRRREKENQALKHQIWVLKHQIEALETIHREIQEKKEQVSPP